MKVAKFVWTMSVSSAVKANHTIFTTARVTELHFGWNIQDVLSVSLYSSTASLQEVVTPIYL